MTDHPTREKVLPFVATTALGGPFDTESWVAGWNAGLLNAALAAGPPEHLSAVDPGNEPQADLIAMRHGYRTEVQGRVDGWVRILFARVEEES